MLGLSRFESSSNMEIMSACAYIQVNNNTTLSHLKKYQMKNLVLEQILN